VSHATRPKHKTAHPVHVTLRALAVVGNLRDSPVFNALFDALAAASRDACRVAHFSVQRDHLHLIVEAHDREALSRGVQGLAIRCAKAINRALKRTGKVWADRYHARELKTPREVRNALVYVLQNRSKTVAGALNLDPCATGSWFDGWRGPRPPWSLPPADAEPPVRAARTWLLTTGWRRARCTSCDETTGGRPPDPIICDWCRSLVTKRTYSRRRAAASRASFSAVRASISSQRAL
jgi:REP element-mobilizing transposase RayT